VNFRAQDFRSAGTIAIQSPIKPDSAIRNRRYDGYRTDSAPCFFL